MSEHAADRAAGATGAACCAARSPRAGARAARRLRPAVAATTWFVERAEQRRDADARASQRAGRRPQGAGAGIHAGRPLADVSQQRHARAASDADYVALRGRRLRRLRARRSTAWSQQPAEFSLAELRALPSRTQITRHDCVEGWSAIGKWKGVPLAHAARRRPSRSRRRATSSSTAPTRWSDATAAIAYYESIDLDDAYHPQTILAYELNDQPLPVAQRRAAAPARRAPARLQAGQVRACASSWSTSFAHIGGGKGGYWEDQGYEWYAGI